MMDQTLRAAHARLFRESLSEQDLSRIDETDDQLFYGRPRMAHHLDARARRTISEIVDALVTDPTARVLDLMSSFDSHLPSSLERARVTGLGLNPEELAANPALSDRVVHDLNRSPRLPFADGTFDAVINVASVDYLVHPLEVFEEVGRVLKPGGLFLVAFSNRLFETKATRVWRQASEEERVILVEAFFEHSLAFTPTLNFVSKGLPRPADDPYADRLDVSDPLFAVFAWRPGPGARRAAASAGEWLAQQTASRPVHGWDPATLRCPHCDADLDIVDIPEDAVGDWGSETAHVCFNDRCPYFVRGWSVNYRSGTRGYSYRFMYDPDRDRCSPLAVPSRSALRDLRRAS